MTTENTTERGIVQRATPCWTILRPNGEGAGFEGAEHHFDTEEQAREAEPGYRIEGEALRIVQVEDQLCWEAFLFCGKRYVYEGDDDVKHFADEANILDCLAGDFLPLVDPGVYACDDDTCTVCAPYGRDKFLGELADGMIDAGRLALQFGRVERKTFHPDGIRPETDTDHTVMLGLIACALAARLYPKLDQGKIAAASLVHDLHETYADDTSTLRELTAEQVAGKQQREQAGQDRIFMEFVGVLPWITLAISWYERQQDPEVRFVRAVDKLAPKLTHILNGAVAARAAGMTAAELTERYDRQRAEIGTYTADFPHLVQLHRILADRMIAALDGAR